jgi:hypothetical protein
MSSNQTHEEIYGSPKTMTPELISPPDWMAVAWRTLEAGEKIRRGDWVDSAANGWKDDPKWIPARETEIGKKAPDPAYPAHRVFRRVLRADFVTRRGVSVVIYHTIEGCRIEWGPDIYLSAVPFDRAVDLAHIGKIGSIPKKWIGKFS